ncbi:MAG: hypothetical protein EZS28_050061, partial [Streblomastix strix]
IMFVEAGRIVTIFCLLLHNRYLSSAFSLVQTQKAPDSALFKTCGELKLEIDSNLDFENHVCGTPIGRWGNDCGRIWSVRKPMKGNGCGATSKIQLQCVQPQQTLSTTIFQSYSLENDKTKL